MPFEKGHPYIGDKPNKRAKLLRHITGEPIGGGLKDMFFDSGKEELLTAHSILDLLKLHESDEITVTFSKKFLDRMIHSHICHIRGL